MKRVLRWIGIAAGSLAGLALVDPQLDLANTVDFAARVMAEDGAACELVQRGLRSRPHAAGVLLPEEYDVYGFQSWVRAELARA